MKTSGTPEEGREQNVVELITSELVRPLTRLLLLRYLGLDHSERAEDLEALARTRTPERMTARGIVWRLEECAAQVARSILDGAVELFVTKDVALLHIARELAATLTAGEEVPSWSAKELDSRLFAGELSRHRAPTTLSPQLAKLHDFLLERLVRYLVEVAAALPQFDPRSPAASLNRLTYFGTDIESILRTARNIEIWAPERENTESTRIERDYRHAIIRSLDYLELFGADISTESRRHALSVAYVSLNLEHASGEDGGEPVSLPVEAMLVSLAPGAGRLLVRGEAGSGKTTLFRWAALQAAGLSVPPGAEQLSLHFAGHGKTALAMGSLWMDLPFEKMVPYAKKRLYASLNKRAPLTILSGAGGHRETLDEERLERRRFRDAQLTLPVGEMIPAGLTAFLSGNFKRTVLPPTSAWRSRIPFLIRLRDCKGGRLPGPNELAALIAKGIGAPPEVWVDRTLRDGRALVLLDGVDEVPTKQRATIRDTIEAIVEEFPDNHYLLSTRPEAVEPNWLRDLGFREARVNPMSEADKARFIDKWHEAVAQELTRLGRPSDSLRGLAGELKDKLPENPVINRLATNPLLCAMICALHRDRHRKLPESQAELCEALCHMLLDRRELESGLDLSDFPEPYRTLSYEQKRAIVQELAHYMVRNEESSIEAWVAEARVGNTLKLLPGCSPADAAVVTRSLMERSGMLREARPGLIDFIHNTFKEFLAAERFVELDDVKHLSDRALDPSWQPIVLFAAASRNEKFVTRLLDRLLGRPSGKRADSAPVPRKRRIPNRRGRRTEDDAARPRQLLALRCRAAAIRVKPQQSEQLDALLEDLFPPRTMADAEALVAGLSVGGQAFAIKHLRYDPKMKATQAAACVRALRLLGSARGHDRLKEYLIDRRASVAVELAQAVDPLTIPYYQEMLSEGLPLPWSVADNVTELSALRLAVGNVEALDLSRINAVDLQPLADLRGLKHLTISCPAVDLRPLASLTSLEGLEIAVPAKDLSPLTHLTALKQLTVTAAIQDVQALAKLTELQSLTLFDTGTGDLSPLSALKKLTFLILDVQHAQDLSFLASLTNIEDLSLLDVTTDAITVLSDLPRLKRLCLAGTIRDVRPLSSLKQLEELEFLDEAPDLAPLASLSNLRLLLLGQQSIADLSPLADAIQRKKLLVFPEHLATPYLNKRRASGRPNVGASGKARQMRGVTAAAEPLEPIDIGIVIALPEEFAELQGELGEKWTPVKSREVAGQYVYKFKRLPTGGPAPYRCVATFVGAMGPTPAGLTTTSFLREWKPSTAVMLGIAGGISKDVRVGDVVLGEVADLYMAGSKAVPQPRGRKDDFKFELSGQPYRASPELIKQGQHFRFAHAKIFEQWQRSATKQLAELVSTHQRLRLLKNDLVRAAPDLMAGSIACGDIVGAAQEFVRWLKRRNRAYLALEMESGGLLAAVHEKADLTRALVIRGISDYGDERKKAVDAIGSGALRRYAMRNAANLLWALLDVEALPRSS